MSLRVPAPVPLSSIGIAASPSRRETRDEERREWNDWGIDGEMRREEGSERRRSVLRTREVWE
jgi:hypothetical protein